MKKLDIEYVLALSVPIVITVVFRIDGRLNFYLPVYPSQPRQNQLLLFSFLFFSFLCSCKSNPPPRYCKSFTKFHSTLPFRREKNVLPGKKNKKTGNKETSYQPTPLLSCAVPPRQYNQKNLLALPFFFSPDRSNCGGRISLVLYYYSCTTTDSNLVYVVVRGTASYAALT